ncbi:MAG: hypothetical protein PHW00_05145 [Clostridia bacterium]|nr:hypothetical protein [Clostridia bacterium]
MQLHRVKIVDTISNEEFTYTIGKLSSTDDLMLKRTAKLQRIIQATFLTTRFYEPIDCYIDFSCDNRNYRIERHVSDSGIDCLLYDTNSTNEELIAKDSQIGVYLTKLLGRNIKSVIDACYVSFYQQERFEKTMDIKIFDDFNKVVEEIKKTDYQAIEERNRAVIEEKRALIVRLQALQDELEARQEQMQSVLPKAVAVNKLRQVLPDYKLLMGKRDNADKLTHVADLIDHRCDSIIRDYLLDNPLHVNRLINKPIECTNSLYADIGLIKQAQVALEISIDEQMALAKQFGITQRTLNGLLRSLEINVALEDTDAKIANINQLLRNEAKRKCPILSHVLERTGEVIPPDPKKVLQRAINLKKEEYNAIICQLQGQITRIDKDTELLGTELMRTEAEIDNLGNTVSQMKTQSYYRDFVLTDRDKDEQVLDHNAQTALNQLTHYQEAISDKNDRLLQLREELLQLIGRKEATERRIDNTIATSTNFDLHAKLIYNAFECELIEKGKVNILPYLKAIELGDSVDLLGCRINSADSKWLIDNADKTPQQRIAELTAEREELLTIKSKLGAKRPVSILIGKREERRETLLNTIDKLYVLLQKKQSLKDKLNDKVNEFSRARTMANKQVKSMRMQSNKLRVVATKENTDSDRIKNKLIGNIRKYNPYPQWTDALLEVLDREDKRRFYLDKLIDKICTYNSRTQNEYKRMCRLSTELDNAIDKQEKLIRRLVIQQERNKQLDNSKVKVIRRLVTDTDKIDRFIVNANANLAMVADQYSVEYNNGIIVRKEDLTIEYSKLSTSDKCLIYICLELAVPTLYTQSGNWLIIDDKMSSQKDVIKNAIYKFNQLNVVNAVQYTRN